jgi:hypothetical protein
MKILIGMAVAFFFLVVPNLYAYFDPSIGRWANRDAIGKAGGLNSYEFVQNNAVEYIDILGHELFVNNHEPETVGCGEYYLEKSIDDDLQFGVDTYVIQEVKMTVMIYNLQSAVPILIHSESHHYWEAFGPFASLTRIHDTDIWQSHVGAQYGGSTMGTEVRQATAKVFSLGTTGYLGSIHDAPDAYGWIPPADPMSGNLPSTITPPTWWSDPPLDGPANSSLFYSWSCSCFGADWSLLLIPPPLKVPWFPK